MDADRMDYLLRDSLHIGVAYGHYDSRRLLNTIRAVEMPQPKGEELKQGLRLGVTEGGTHAAEALVLARYFMFTQVYFHKTRVAYDHHLRHTLAELLPDGVFPTPEPGMLKSYLGWDDWKVLGLLAEGKGGEHGERLRQRNHYREVYHTPECPSDSDLSELQRVEDAVNEFIVAKEEAGKSWYKIDRTDIPIVSETDGGKIRPLSEYSPMVKNLRPIRRISLYALPEKADETRASIGEILKTPEA
jgi:HD superfamily phosphohydrolase